MSTYLIKFNRAEYKEIVDVRVKAYNIRQAISFVEHNFTSANITEVRIFTDDDEHKINMMYDQVKDYLMREGALDEDQVTRIRDIILEGID